MYLVRRKYILAGLTSILILCSFTSASLMNQPFVYDMVDIDQETVNKDVLSPQDPLNLAQDLHAAIAITGNADFNDTAYAEGWFGNGSEINPYIISNYSIIATAPVIGGIL